MRHAKHDRADAAAVPIGGRIIDGALGFEPFDGDANPLEGVVKVGELAFAVVEIFI